MLLFVNKSVILLFFNCKIKLAHSLGVIKLFSILMADKALGLIDLPWLISGWKDTFLFLVYRMIGFAGVVSVE